MLLEQIQMFEALFADRTGMQIAYRRMHHINSLVREIESFTETKYNKRLVDVVCDLPAEVCQDDTQDRVIN